MSAVRSPVRGTVMGSCTTTLNRAPWNKTLHAADDEYERRTKALALVEAHDPDLSHFGGDFRLCNRCGQEGEQILKIGCFIDVGLRRFMEQRDQARLRYPRSQERTEVASDRAKGVCLGHDGPVSINQRLGMGNTQLAPLQTG
ncbi:MAG: hypothetical protein RLZZ141_2159, partial [Pseudomonadota bacterium]